MSKLKFLIKMFWYLIFIFYYLFIYLFIFGCAESLLLHMDFL